MFEPWWTGDSALGTGGGDELNLGVEAPGAELSDGEAKGGVLP